MSLPERISAAITTHSKIVLVALLLTTALVGAGATMVDDDSSLDQFETDTPEAEAVEYANENFTVEGEENTTSVQLIVRGENVLTKESLLDSLAFQQTLRENESVNATLVEDPTFGVENVLGITVVQSQQGEALAERGQELENDSAELEARGEELAERAEQLEQDQAELEARGEELEERGAQLEQDQAELEERGAQLEEDRAELEEASAELEAEQERLEERVAAQEEALNETAELQTAYEEADSDQERAGIEAEMEELWAETTADLDSQQTERFEESATAVRQLTSDRLELETAIEGAYETGIGVTDDPDRQAELEAALDETADLQRQIEATDDDGEQAALEEEIDEVWAEATAELDAEQTETFVEAATQVRESTAGLVGVEEGLEGAYQGGTVGVLADEFEALEERGQALEERGQALEERGQALEDDSAELEERGEQLEQDRQALEEDGEELEERGEQLAQDQEALEEDGEELEERGEQLERDQAALEDGDTPTLDEQIEAIESLDDEEFEDYLTDIVSDNDGDSPALNLMPTGYEPGSTSSDARMVFITQDADMGEMAEMGGGGGDAMDAQLDMRDLAQAHAGDDEEYIVFGFGVIGEEIDNSMNDSLAIVGPLALLFVVVALSVAYRDPLDIVLGVLGILVVLIWTFGFMGWTGIAFNQMFVAVPVLLIGLSIDYAIHVFMRHREQRERGAEADSAVRPSMTIALAGVGVALVWVTATTVIGFLSNLISPIAPIREFGIVSAAGILAALIVFGALVPAAKVEIDSLFESRGFNRRKRAFGTGGGRFSSVLTVGSTAARKAPLIIIVAALLLTAGGVYGATQVDTSFEEEDFLADSPPEWTQYLGPLAPGEYQAKDDLEYVNENFQREDTQTQILIRGPVTDDATLGEIDRASSDASESDIAYILPTGEVDVESPLTVMENAASENESFNESFTAADTTGDGVPDQNLEELYDELFEVDESAASNVIYRTDDGEYEAVRMIIGVQGDAAFGDVTSETRAIADGFGGEWDVIATGDPIVNYLVEQDLLDTVLESLMITLVAVFVFLTVAYWLTGNSATLGAVTLLPVAFSVSWILGTMYLIGMPFNVLTGMITSLTIGLGVAYSIHVSARYTLELERQGNVWTAMRTTVTGTGGALLGSAATTVGGFGTLALAILPALQQFGIITGLTIIYAFLASVVVLPSLLVLWTRYFGPDVSFDAARTGPATPAASDGGRNEPVPSSGGDDR
ncbi:MMPL family transporter [Natrononativus amylolyticus]|uniref:MMPL family transporter n=1 Tax=Natrononativus amylolyticus TaxID=2963434 RepID=UPI0020CC3670|nr:MMPL family transporter [Natrononativus amylolyticus]